MTRIAMTPQQFEDKRQQLASEHGITLSGNDGTASADGYSVDYNYDGTTLSIDVTQSHRFVPKTFAEHKIVGWLQD